MIRIACHVPLLERLIGIMTELITFYSPAITVLVSLFSIAVWAMVTGILKTVTAG